MDQILQEVIEPSRTSLIDGFTGHNQVTMDLKDWKNTSLISPWGASWYNEMLLGLINSKALSQKAMDIAFPEERHKFMLTSMGDMTRFPKNDEDQLDHLK